MDGERHMTGRIRNCEISTLIFAPFRNLGERGMFSVFGICALGTLMFLSATIYAISMNHTASARRFLERGVLRNAAEDGVRLAVAKLNAEPQTAAKAETATAKHVRLLDGASGDAKYTVYARKKDGKILLLGIGAKGAERARAVGVAREQDGTYAMDHWER